MCQQRQLEFPQYGTDPAQIVRLHPIEFGNAGIDHEALEPEYAGVRKLRQLRAIARYDASPESNVDVNPASRDLYLLAQRIHRSCRRNGIQRHIHERRYAARCRRACTTDETFPVRTTRLVQMNVRINYTRHERYIFEIPVTRAFDRPYRYDHTVLDDNVRSLLTVQRYNSTATESCHSRIFLTDSPTPYADTLPSNASRRSV